MLTSTVELDEGVINLAAYGRTEFSALFGGVNKRYATKTEWADLRRLSRMRTSCFDRSQMCEERKALCQEKSTDSHGVYPSGHIFTEVTLRQKQMREGGEEGSRRRGIRPPREKDALHLLYASLGSRAGDDPCSEAMQKKLGSRIYSGKAGAFPALRVARYYARLVYLATTRVTQLGRDSSGATRKGKKKKPHESHSFWWRKPTSRRLGWELASWVIPGSLGY